MKLALVLGSLSGFIAVGLGAFGAHALKDLLGVERMTIYETANRYQFYHTFAIFVSAILYSIYQERKFLISSYLFTIGIVFFSGSLYALSLSGIRILGAITPIGGVLFLAGWANLCYTGLKLK